MERNVSFSSAAFPRSQGPTPVPDTQHFTLEEFSLHHQNTLPETVLWESPLNPSRHWNEFKEILKRIVFNQAFKMSPLSQDSNGNFRTDMSCTYLLVQSSSLWFCCWIFTLENGRQKNIWWGRKRREGRSAPGKEVNFPSLVNLMKEEMQHINPTRCKSD